MSDSEAIFRLISSLEGRQRTSQPVGTTPRLRSLGQGFCMVMFIAFALSTEAWGQTCHRAILQEPTPFMGNGGEIIQLDDGSYWKEVGYQYLFLNEYSPSVTICPEQGTLALGDNSFPVAAVECRKAVMQEPTPFKGNGGELIVLNDGTLWKDTSYQYLYLDEYHPSVVICPDEGLLQVGDNQFTVSQIEIGSIAGRQG